MGKLRPSRIVLLNLLKEGIFDKKRDLEKEYISVRKQITKYSNKSIVEQIMSLENDRTDSKSNVVESGLEVLKKREQDIKDILQCFKALKDIESDLFMLEEHLNGSDFHLKESAEVFHKEFSRCRNEIENELNALL